MFTSSFYFTCVTKICMTLLMVSSITADKFSCFVICSSFYKISYLGIFVLYSLHVSLSTIFQTILLKVCQPGQLDIQLAFNTVHVLYLYLVISFTKIIIFINFILNTKKIKKDKNEFMLSIKNAITFLL